jgi:hypothetical protein
VGKLGNADEIKSIARPPRGLEASKQRRLRAWNVLQRFRSILSEAGSVAIPQPAQKTTQLCGGLVRAKAYREISGFPCRDHTLWINPALDANPFESELLKRSPRNIIAVVIVLEMLKLLALSLAAIHGDDCVGVCC